MSNEQGAESDNTSDSDTEWIEVENSSSYLLPTNSEATPVCTLSRPLEITIQPRISKRKWSIVERYLKMYERSQRILLHNTHLTCLVARLQLIIKLCAEQMLQAAVLSLLPAQLAYTQGETHLAQTHVEQVLRWYKNEFGNLRRELDKEVQERMEEFQLSDLHVFVSLLTVIGYRTRLVQNLIVTQGKEELNKSSNNKRQPKQSKNAIKKITANLTSTSNEKSPYFQIKSAKSDTPVSRQSDRLKRLKVDYTFKHSPEHTADSGEEFQTPKQRKKSSKKHKPETGEFENEWTMPEKKACVSTHLPLSEYEVPSDEWLEVKLEDGWMPFHYKLGRLVDAGRCAQLASPGSLIYVVGSEVGGKVRDMTARYSLQWGGRHVKLRLDNEEWAFILALGSPPENEEDQLELSLLESDQLSLPLPPKLTYFKSNPYYTLERHLLKFQAIHPEDCAPAGTFRGEKVYFRRNVVELHTRENWLKEGRIISRGESAYKTAKGRNKPGAEVEGERMIELFGKWQSEIYIPPPVVDGKIPKNEFGNVEMFQPFMLPEGAAHVDLPGIAYMARKLGIDYALAMVGWEFHGIACHPVFKGVVVARENEQMIREAWQEGEDAKREKERAVREKKVFERWRKVIRFALIKERVKEKFNLSDSEMDVT